MNYYLRQSIRDDRDLLYAVRRAPELEKLPRKANLTAKMPPVYNQESLGSCAANAGCGYMSYKSKEPSGYFTELSRMFLYQMARSLEGTLSVDSGVTMRSIPKALNQFGVCEEKYFPYNIKNFALPATQAAMTNALNNKIIEYNLLKTLQEIKHSVAIHKMPVLIGMQVFENFESKQVAKTGMLPVPISAEKSLGGHAVLVCGYEDKSNNSGNLIVRNSWGSAWGNKGYFNMPYDFFNKYTFDYWTLF